MPYATSLENVVIKFIQDSVQLRRCPCNCALRNCFVNAVSNHYRAQLYIIVTPHESELVIINGNGTILLLVETNFILCTITALMTSQQYTFIIIIHLSKKELFKKDVETFCTTHIILIQCFNVKETTVLGLKYHKTVLNTRHNSQL